MAEASMIGNFNAKVSEFNSAVKDGDVEAVARLGGELLRIALDECSKVGVNNAVKENYKKQCAAIISQMSYFAQKPALPVSQSGGAGGENGDPYYVTKQWFSDEVPKLNFTDIIGVQEVKDAFIVDVVAPLTPTFQELYHRFRGNQIGSQILLYGPPGTGKTHIVKCLAGALNCKIAVVQTSEVLASVVGVAEKNIRDIFKQAAELDRCLIFLDEIDSICSDRSSDDSRNTKSVLTTLLTCMDGFIKTTKPNQFRIIVAATNLPWKLDSALKRGGRFETQIYVPLPDKDARGVFIKNALDGIPHDANVTVDDLVKKLEGFSGADIKAVLRQVANRPLKRAIILLRKGKKEEAYAQKITKEDCDYVIANYINSVNEEMLLRFKAYELGITYKDLLAKLNKPQGGTE